MLHETLTNIVVFLQSKNEGKYRFTVLTALCLRKRDGAGLAEPNDSLHSAIIILWALRN